MGRVSECSSSRTTGVSTRRRRSRLWRARLGVAAALMTTLFVVTPAAGQTPGPLPLQVVLLGDSYSAGNGAGDYYGLQMCFRSKDNWAERYVESLPYKVILINRACSGSRTAHLTTPRTETLEHVETIPGEWTSPTQPGLEDAIRSTGHCLVLAPDEETNEITVVRVTPGAGTSQVEFTCRW